MTSKDKVSSSSKTLLIDTDAGVDDAHALMVAMTHSCCREIVAITCTHGNCSIDKVVRNVSYVLKVFNRPIPVYKGAKLPLIEPFTDHVFHGTDGLGDIEDRVDNDEWMEAIVQPDHAVHAMITLSKRYEGEITLVSLGPLTNLALACRLDANFPGRLNELIIMGGNFTGRGNITLTAEFNFGCDPEAAAIVLNEFPNSCPVQLVPLEATLCSSVSWEWVCDDWFKQQTSKSNFNKSMFKNVIETCKLESPEGYPAWDVVAVAVALEPNFVLDSFNALADVELSGRKTRGQVVIAHNVTNKKYIKIIKKTDQELLRNLLYASCV